ncbi:MAG: Lrp/AsnC family transcriptional regulator for asnA, asnC and gidA [Luteibaculaceae bacterium]|jgi:Lrp/AsnC family transcriptional regulator for asnA, asnC and gidA
MNMVDDFHFDSTDRKIVKYLIRDARMKVVDIASAIGVTGAAIHQRLSKIRKSGLVQQFTVQLDERKLGFKTCCFVGVFLDKNSQYQEVLGELSGIEEVVEVYYTTGQYGLFLKVYAQDNDQLMQILNGRIQKIKGITRTETFISLEQPIQRGVPV